MISCSQLSHERLFDLVINACCPPMPSLPTSPTDCTAWRFGMIRQWNVCSAPAPRSSAVKQWTVPTRSNDEDRNFSHKCYFVLISRMSFLGWVPRIWANSKTVSHDNGLTTVFFCICYTDNQPATPQPSHSATRHDVKLLTGRLVS